MSTEQMWDFLDVWSEEDGGNALYHAYFDENNLYNPLADVFKFSHAQEPKEVEDYWTGKKYSCFFRRNKDTNQTNNNVSIYYPVSEGIHNGKLLKFRGRTFLSLNQETVENDVYYRSDLIETNMTILQAPYSSRY